MKLRSFCLKCALVALACLPNFAQADIQYSFETIDYPTNTRDTFLNGINIKWCCGRLSFQ